MTPPFGPTFKEGDVVGLYWGEHLSEREFQLRYINAQGPDGATVTRQEKSWEEERKARLQVVSPLKPTLIDTL